MDIRILGIRKEEHMGKSINDILIEDFQSVVGDLLMRNRSILDIISKIQTSAGRVNRSVIKAVTHCGCVEIEGKKQEFPGEANMEDLHQLMSTHLKGKLCDECRAMVEEEIGGTLFYLAALCNTLGISMYDAILKEKETLNTLGSYSLK
jgi:hypothetical protein